MLLRVQLLKNGYNSVSKWMEMMIWRELMVNPADIVSHYVDSSLRLPLLRAKPT